jgi:type IV pilus assembly protein PilM
MRLPSLPKSWIHRERPVLGLDMGSHTIKLIEFSGSGTNRVVRRVGRILSPPHAIVDGSIKEPEKVSEAVKDLLNNVQPKNRHAATSIAGYSVIVKKISVPYSDEREIEDNLILEAENYVPFEIEEVYIDFHLLEAAASKGGGREIFLVAAKREVVDEYANLIQNVGLAPAVVDVDAFALSNAFERSFGLLDEPVALVDIGAQKTNLNIIMGGMSLFARDMSLGGEQLTEAIKDATGVSYQEAEELKIAGSKDKTLMREAASVIVELCGMWGSELKKALDFYYANSKPNEKPTHLFLSGGSALLEGLDKVIGREVKLPAKTFNPLQNLAADPGIDAEYLSRVAPQMAIASGLALRTS